MDEDVFHVVSNGHRLKSSKQATLSGYKTYFWPGQQFPYLKKEAGSTVNGLLINIDSKEALRRINYFEDTDYSLKQVVVHDLSTNEIFKAMTYFPTDKLKSDVVSKEWTFSEWKKCKKSYLEMTMRFVKNYRGPSDAY